ncbi:MAG: hypothetical protein FD166_632 [Bacteroidetes bacterium]|nr:MAG: hypothetical protein FD166_632 [Bacteroidota bacterium]
MKRALVKAIRTESSQAPEVAPFKGFRPIVFGYCCLSFPEKPYGFQKKDAHLFRKRSLGFI